MKCQISRATATACALAVRVAEPPGLEVRLADFYAPEVSEPGGEAAKAALKGLALNRPISCQAQGRSYDRVVAYCTVGGRSVRDLLRAAGVKEGGRGWRR